MSVLHEILVAKRRRLASGELSPERFGRGAGAPSDGLSFVEALEARQSGGTASSRPAGEIPGPGVLAEIKHRSPSAGTILEDPEANVERLARAYRRGGAAALSVVVEQDFFGGDPAWLPRAKAASGLPVLMKDFVVEESQLDLALALGADAVLLIVAALSRAELATLHRAARARGLAVLVEAHDAGELRLALDAGAEIVGLNARDLKTFAVDLGRVEELGRSLPPSVVRVAESGIRSRADVERLAAAGFGAFLVGESLIRSGDGARAVRSLRGVGTTEVKVCGVTRGEDLGACEGAGVDWIGLNLSPLSRRRVSLEAARGLRERCAFAKGTALVFAGNTDDEIGRAVAELAPDVVQLTDSGSAAPAGPRVWRTVRVGEGDLPLAASRVASRGADALLFDTADREAAGGTGRAFSWSDLSGLSRDRAWVLAGGLRPENVGEAIREVRPDVVDVASGVESGPGVKDAERVAAFVRAVREVRA